MNLLSKSLDAIYMSQVINSCIIIYCVKHYIENNIIMPIKY